MTQETIPDHPSVTWEAEPPMHPGLVTDEETFPVVELNFNEVSLTFEDVAQLQRFKDELSADLESVAALPQGETVFLELPRREEYAPAPETPRLRGVLRLYVSATSADVTVLAAPLDEPFDVHGEHGEAGDYLMVYPPETMSIMSCAEFESHYHLVVLTPAA